MKTVSIRTLIWVTLAVSTLLFLGTGSLILDLSTQTRQMTDLIEDAREVNQEAMHLILLASELNMGMTHRLRDQWAQTAIKLRRRASESASYGKLHVDEVGHYSRILQGLLDRLENQAGPLIQSSDQLSISLQGDLQATLVRIGEAAGHLSDHAVIRLGEVEEKLEKLFLLMLAIMFATAVLPLLLLLYLIERPVNSVVEGVRRLESGDLSTRLPPGRTKEINLISDSINQSLSQLERLSVSRDLLIQEVERRRLAEEKALKSLQALREAQEQLLHMEKLSTVSTFVGGLAHELNNPIMGIEGYLDYVSERTRDDPKIQTALEKARKQLQRVTRLTGSVLSLSQRPDLGAGECQLAPVVKEVCDLMEIQARSLSAQILHDPVDSELLAAVNTEAITQILSNLVSNALDAVADAEVRRIRVSVTGDEEQVVIKVSDSGPGVPSNVVNRIFDPFFTTKPAGKGTGLGLGIVARIASDSGGSVACESPGPDGGAEFTVKLPRALP